MIPPSTTIRNSFSNKGFTIVELLCVLAVIAVLLAFLVPMLGGARRQMGVMETKARFQRLTLALEAFKSEYGAYPALGNSPVEVNATPGQWVELLTGHGLAGGPAMDSVAVAQNPKNIKFLDFSNAELDSEGRILDSLGRTDISYYVDGDGDGFLDTLPGRRGRIGFKSAGDPEITSF